MNCWIVTEYRYENHNSIEPGAPFSGYRFSIQYCVAYCKKVRVGIAMQETWPFCHIMFLLYLQIATIVNNVDTRRCSAGRVASLWLNQVRSNHSLYSLYRLMQYLISIAEYRYRSYWWLTARILRYLFGQKSIEQKIDDHVFWYCEYRECLPIIMHIIQINNNWK